MEWKDRNILVAGMGKSGCAIKDALLAKGAAISIYDKNPYEKMDQTTQSQISAKIITAYLGGEEPLDMASFDMLVASPGISQENTVMVQAKEAAVEVIGELELSYRMSLGKYIAITGTNGKTTTTTLTYEMFKEAGKIAELVGNIGTPAVSRAEVSDENTWFITEVSSFQLETIKSFRPRGAAILNITPDHLDRHKTFENYADCKMRIFENQNEGDYFVVNFDDRPTWELAAERCRCKIVPFSRKQTLPMGCFVQEGDIVVADEKGGINHICKIKDIKIPGAHNLENALAASALAFFAGVPAEVLGRVLSEFLGVEHRLEFVKTVNGVGFVNDSKGTNPDASIKAIEAMGNNTILIAGGYDKNGSFDQFIKSFCGRVKHLVLLGETAVLIRDTALALGFDKITMAGDMENSVKQAYELAKQGDTILLSPACASWDMYSCFEERGEDFKNCVKGLEPCDM